MLTYCLKRNNNTKNIDLKKLTMTNNVNVLLVWLRNQDF